MKKLIYIILMTLLTACGSVSRVSIQPQQELKKESFRSEEKELKSLVLTIRENQKNMALKTEEMNLHLSAINSDKPAIYEKIRFTK